MRISELIGSDARNPTTGKGKNRARQTATQEVGRKPMNKLNAPSRAHLVTVPHSSMAPAVGGDRVPLRSIMASFTAGEVLATQPIGWASTGSGDWW